MVASDVLFGLVSLLCCLLMVQAANQCPNTDSTTTGMETSEEALKSGIATFYDQVNHDYR